MISISQKCQYALRAVFELARREGDKPTTIGEIAAVQAIPPRFLELILNELRQARIVDSRRGAQGGYILVASPRELTVGEIIRLVDGEIEPVKCIAGGRDCPLRGNCAFMDMWKRGGRVMAEVFDGTTFQDLLDKDRSTADQCAGSYTI